MRYAVKKKRLYIAVTNDEYELPVFIEETLDSLGEKVGVSGSNICHHLRGTAKCKPHTPYKYVRIEVME